MLNYTLSRFGRSVPADLADTAIVSDEGMALVAADNGSGGLVVTPSTGAANEAFYGVALFERRIPATLSKVVSVAGTGAEFTQVLSGYVDGSARIVIISADGTRAAAIVAAGVTQEAVVAADGTLTVRNTVEAGNTVEVTFTYTPTAMEVVTLQGEADTLSAVAQGAQVGVLKEGLAFVSNFDTSAAWAIGDVPKLGANGRFVRDGAGSDVTSGVVVALPTVSNPHLGIELG